jgi:hypothetical protein
MGVLTTRAALAAVGRAVSSLTLQRGGGCRRGDVNLTRRARHGGCVAAAAAAVTRGGDADAPPRARGFAHHAGGLGPAAGVISRYVQIFAVGVSPPPPSCSRQSLASFSRSSYGGGIDHIKLNQRISGAKNLREVLSAVHDSHQDFRPRDAATAYHRLAKHVGKYGQTIKSDEDVATFQLAINAAVSKASGMDPQQVSNTMCAFGTLSEKGVVVDEAAVRAVSA